MQRLPLTVKFVYFATLIVESVSLSNFELLALSRLQAGLARPHRLRYQRPDLDVAVSP